MNADLGKTAFTPEEIDDLRDRLRAHKEVQGLSWTQLHTITGVAAGTLSGWVPGTYNHGKVHETHDIAAKVYRFFLSLEEKEALEAVLPREPDFQPTPSSRRIMTCLAMAQLGDMAMISTPPGCGKSAAIKQYAATRGQVFVATMSPVLRGLPNMLSAILAAMGEKGAKGTPAALSARVCARMMGSGALIVLDEAQNLSSQSLEQARSIHDETDCGVALAGDETLIANLKRYPQLYSRLGIRHVQPRPTADDVTILAQGWGVERGAELAFLQEIGRKSGGLRTITKTMKLAVRAARAGGAPLCVTDLRDAYAQRYGDAA